jgi:succinate-semialdehyde dehydrogenase/glutarate-semialdehyde dehydrogenase
MKFGHKKLYIGGELREASGGAKRDVLCPATEEVIATVAWAGPADAAAALAAADAGFKVWSKTPIKARVAVMQRLRALVIRDQDKLREAVMFEHGKTWEQAEEDVVSLINALGYYGEEIMRMRGEILPDAEGTHEHKLVREPLGVVVAYLAWNFPLLNLAFKLGPALAAGCAIIIKPSSETPISALMVGELCAEAGVPAGVVNILAGPSDPVASILSGSKIPRLLTLIGSTATGQQIIQQGSSSIKRYSMELGGNAPALVFADADLDHAAFLISLLKFSNTGQICVTPNRVLVEQSVFDGFAAKVVAHAQKVKLGHGRGSGATMGPLINAAARERIESWVNEAVDQGAIVLHGGKCPAGLAKGSYYEPTVLKNVTPAMRVCCDEVFGPVVSLLPFKDEADALAQANATDAGLSSFLFTNDQARAQRVSAALEFGEVMINGVKYNIDLPHGGVKQSGIGHDCSHLALHDYLTVKRITTALR